MNILIVPPTVGFQGGIERYCYDLSISLRHRGHRVYAFDNGRRGRDSELFVQAFDGLLNEEEAKNTALDVVYGQKIVEPKELERLPKKPLLLAVHDHDHTCVRSHRYLPLNDQPCHRAPGAACVTHGCWITFKRNEKGQRSPVLRNPFRLVTALGSLSQRAIFVACSHYIRERLLDAGVSPARAVVVHPVLPEEKMSVTTRASQKRLLFVGQLLHGKGVEHVINSLRYLPDAVLEIVGDGPSREPLQTLSSSVAPGRVTFSGYLRPAEVDRAYARSNMVVVPSHWPEPFGMVGIEAMRRARPVVGANHGGIPEWLQEGSGGALFEPGSAKELASAVVRVFSDVAAGEKARQYVETYFRYEETISRIESIMTMVALFAERSRWGVSTGFIV